MENNNELTSGEFRLNCREQKTDRSAIACFFQEADKPGQAA